MRIDENISCVSHYIQNVFSSINVTGICIYVCQITKLIPNPVSEEYLPWFLEKSTCQSLVPLLFASLHRYGNIYISHWHSLLHLFQYKCLYCPLSNMKIKHILNENIYERMHYVLIPLIQCSLVTGNCSGLLICHMEVSFLKWMKWNWLPSRSKLLLFCTVHFVYCLLK